VLGDLGGADARFDEPALANPGPGHDPLVGRVHDPGEHFVRDDLGRKVAA